jgi:uncharacterized protein (TIGR02145 family)
MRVSVVFGRFGLVKKKRCKLITNHFASYTIFSRRPLPVSVEKRRTIKLIYKFFKTKIMRMTNLFISTAIAMAFLFSACGNSGSQQKNISAGIEGKTGLKIGEKVWMPKNLDVTTFKNGDQIKEAKTADEWKFAYENKEPAWCYYENNPENGKKYGVLYNWFAVNDSRGLCPEGWSIASENDWKDLVNALGGSNTAGNAMKIKNEWNNDANADNSSGFSALPAGLRDANGDFLRLNQTAVWWTSTEWIGNKICTYVLEAGQNYCIDYPANTDEANAVRCVKN